MSRETHQALQRKVRRLNNIVRKNVKIFSWVLTKSKKSEVLSGHRPWTLHLIANDNKSEIYGSVYKAKNFYTFNVCLRFPNNTYSDTEFTLTDALLSCKDAMIKNNIIRKADIIKIPLSVQQLIDDSLGKTPPAVEKGSTKKNNNEKEEDNENEDEDKFRST